MSRESRPPWAILVLAAGVLGPTSLVLAHGIEVRAYARSGEIVVEASHHDGTSLDSASVTITGPDGEPLAHGPTNAEGVFAFSLDALPDHIHIVVDEGSGHRTERTITREKLGAGRPANESRSGRILAGLGIIGGITGVAAYCFARKTSHRRS